MNKPIINSILILLIVISSCSKPSKDCTIPNSEFNETLGFCACKEGFVDYSGVCECPKGTELIEGQCLTINIDELFDDWEADEECDQAGDFKYEIEIKKSPDPNTILINNLFEINQDIECTLKNGGCEFSGDPKINGFLVEGEMTWNEEITVVLIEYTIKGTVEENCSATLTLP